jgi:hypothetical protein
MINKIIFVSSAGFSYQEFILDGDTHFSGANGLGKTSLLKAILLAYSGETSDFTQTDLEYFFPSPHAMIVFEMGNGKQAFTACVNKSEVNPEILLVKGMYEREIFIGTNHKPFTSEVIIKNIKKRKLDYLAQIKTGDDYRKIIYGQETGKSKSVYRKFALLMTEKAGLLVQSQKDIFENRFLSLPDIKCRIAALSWRDNQRIDIAGIQEKLQGFIHHWRSVETFRNNREMISEIGLVRSQIETCEKEIKTLAVELTGLTQAKEACLKTLKKEISGLEKELQATPDRLRKGEKQHVEALESLLYEKARLTCQRDLFLEKDKYYQGLDIANLKVSAASLSLWEEKKQAIQLALKNFNTPTKNTAKKTGPREEHAYLQLQETIHRRELENQWLAKREAILRNSWDKLTQLETVFQQKISEVNQQIAELDEEIDSRKETAFRIRRESITDLAGEESTGRLVRLEEEFYQLSIEKERSQNRLVYLQKQKESEAEDLARDEEIALKAHKSEMDSLNQQVESVKNSIANLRGSFQEWLEGNYPDWEQSIGKICRPEVLFNPYLGPDIERLNDLFYGIKLDLDEVEVNLTSGNDLKNQLSELQVELEKRGTEGLAIRQQFEKKKNNLDKRFRQKIRQEENELKKLNYEIDQVKIRIRQHKQTSRQQLQGLIQEAERKAIGIDYQIQEKEKIREELKGVVAQTYQDWEARKEKLRKSSQEKLHSLEEKYQKDENELGEKFRQLKTNELANQAIESLTVEELHVALFEVEEAIEQAQKKREILRAYTEHLNTPQDQWEAELEIIETKITNLTSGVLLSSSIQQQDLQELEKNLQAKEEEKAVLERKIAIAKSLPKDPVLRIFFTGKMKADETTPRHSDLAVLAEMIRAQSQQLSVASLKLKQLMNRLLSMLGNENLMALSLSDKSEGAYRKLAQKIEAFEQDSQLNVWEDRLATQYASLVDEISLLTRPFDSLESDLQRSTDRLDELLGRFSFDIHFPRIRFSYGSSQHPLIASLRKIRDFAAENANQLGAGTLFNQTENQTGNQRAIELLIDLCGQLQVFPGEFLKPEIFFTLNIHKTNQAGELEKIDSLLSGLGNGFIRMYQVIIQACFIAMVLENAEMTIETPIHCCLDNLQELERSRIEQLADFMRGLALSVVSASVAPVFLKNIQYGYQLSEKTESKISAYQLLSRVG